MTQVASINERRSFRRKPHRLVVFPPTILPPPPSHMVACRSSQAAQFPGLHKPTIFHVHLIGSFPPIQSCFHRHISG